MGFVRGRLWVYGREGWKPGWWSGCGLVYIRDADIIFSPFCNERSSGSDLGSTQSLFLSSTLADWSLTTVCDRAASPTGSNVYTLQALYPPRRSQGNWDLVSHHGRGLNGHGNIYQYHLNRFSHGSHSNKNLAHRLTKVRRQALFKSSLANCSRAGVVRLQSRRFSSRASRQRTRSS